MSLDVHLISQSRTESVRCEHCGHSHDEQINDEFYHANITHNLNEMARHAGIYYVLWRPEELGATQAKDILPYLEDGLIDLKARPDYYRQFNAPNGWGMYEHFVPFVEEYLKACEENP